MTKLVVGVIAVGHWVSITPSFYLDNQVPGMMNSIGESERNGGQLVCKSRPAGNKAKVKPRGLGRPVGGS